MLKALFTVHRMFVKVWDLRTLLPFLNFLLYYYYLYIRIVHMFCNRRIKLIAYNTVTLSM